MRERILECLGTFPKKVDLNLVELESIEKDFIDDIIMKGNNTNGRNA